MQQTILFDLDGTLLPMDLERFIDLYLRAFSAKFSQKLQLPPKALTGGIWEGANAMAHNDGRCLNRELFWDTLSRACGRNMWPYEQEFDDFYRHEFIAAKEATQVNPHVVKMIAALRASGRRLILATNPLFPKPATHARIRWAGLDPSDFDYITLYDNCTTSKPNLQYYRDICAHCGVKPEECLMVGNDVDEDMCAGEIGMQSFLVTDCLINRHGKSIDRYPHGDVPLLSARLLSG